MALDDVNKSGDDKVVKTQGEVDSRQSSTGTGVDPEKVQRNDGSDASDPAREEGRLGNPDPHVGDIVPKNDGVIPENMNTPTVKNEPGTTPPVSEGDKSPENTDGKWEHDISSK